MQSRPRATATLPQYPPSAMYRKSSSSISSLVKTFEQHRVQSWPTPKVHCTECSNSLSEDRNLGAYCCEALVVARPAQAAILKWKFDLYIQRHMLLVSVCPGPSLRNLTQSPAPPARASVSNRLNALNRRATWESSQKRISDIA